MKYTAKLIRVQVLDVKVEGATEKEAVKQAVEASKVVNDTSWKTISTEVRKLTSP